MSKLSDEINKGDKIFSKSNDEFLRSVMKSEILIYDELIKILNTLNVSGGKLQTNSEAENFLMSMDKKIYDALKRANYDQSVLQYTRNFNLIADNTKNIQSLMNGINITDDQIKPFLKIEVNNTIDRLTGSGLAKDFINPIRQNLYRNIMLGADLTSVEKNIKDFVISNKNGDSQLMKYVKQVSRDSMHQFDGTLQQNISDKLGLNALRYVGSLIDDSRAQCVKWVTENNGVLMKADLAEEIRWAIGNGTYRGQRCSGMNPATTADTFIIFRGGFNCKHRCFPTNKKG